MAPSPPLGSMALPVAGGRGGAWRGLSVTDKRPHPGGARAGPWGTVGGGSPHTPHKATPEPRVLQASLMRRGPWPEDTLTVVAHRAVWLVTCMTTFLFFYLLLPEPLEGPCGPGGEPHGASWGDKEGRAEGSEQTWAFTPKSLRAPQHLLPSVQQQTTPGKPPAAKGSAVGGVQETSTSMFVPQATTTVRSHLM